MCIEGTAVTFFSPTFSVFFFPHLSLGTWDWNIHPCWEDTCTVHAFLLQNTYAWAQCLQIYWSLEKERIQEAPPTIFFFRTEFKRTQASDASNIECRASGKLILIQCNQVFQAACVRIWDTLFRSGQVTEKRDLEPEKAWRWLEPFSKEQRVFLIYINRRNPFTLMPNSRTFQSDKYMIYL